VLDGIEGIIRIDGNAHESNDPPIFINILYSSKVYSVQVNIINQLSFPISTFHKWNSLALLKWHQKRKICGNSGVLGLALGAIFQHSFLITKFSAHYCSTSLSHYPSTLLDTICHCHCMSIKTQILLILRPIPSINCYII